MRGEPTCLKSVRIKGQARGSISGFRFYADVIEQRVIGWRFYLGMAGPLCRRFCKAYRRRKCPPPQRLSGWGDNDKYPCEYTIHIVYRRYALYKDRDRQAPPYCCKLSDLCCLCLPTFPTPLRGFCVGRNFLFSAAASLVALWKLASTTSQSMALHHSSRYAFFPPMPQSRNQTCSHVLTVNSMSRSAPP